MAAKSNNIDRTLLIMECFPKTSKNAQQERYSTNSTVNKSQKDPVLKSGLSRKCQKCLSKIKQKPKLVTLNTNEKFFTLL